MPIRAGMVGGGGGPAELEVAQGGGPAGFPELPSAPFDHATEHLPTFLDGNHEVGDWLLF